MDLRFLSESDTVTSNLGKTKKLEIDKKMKKLKKAIKKAGKKNTKVDRSDVPLVSPSVTTDLI
jgi:hypothetical protein